VQRAEDFVAWARPKRLSELTVEEITAFSPRCAREQALTDWQFRQIVDAPQSLLLDLAQSGGDWFMQWGALVSGRPLDAAQPLRAAAMSPEAAVAADPMVGQAIWTQVLLTQLTETLRAER
jgi:hypothetical protein